MSVPLGVDHLPAAKFVRPQFSAHIVVRFGVRSVALGGGLELNNADFEGAVGAAADTEQVDLRPDAAKARGYLRIGVSRGWAGLQQRPIDSRGRLAASGARPRPNYPDSPRHGAARCWPRGGLE